MTLLEAAYQASVAVFGYAGINFSYFMNGADEAEIEILTGGGTAVDEILEETSYLEDGSTIDTLIHPYDQGRRSQAEKYLDQLETKEGLREFEAELQRQKETQIEMDFRKINHALAEGVANKAPIKERSDFSL
ncbi:MAG: hypothetical protein ACI9LV_000205 [Candidatus Nanohaloarchaea archaeon]|jgi:hypothetical protein